MKCASADIAKYNKASSQLIKQHTLRNTTQKECNKYLADLYCFSQSYQICKFVSLNIYSYSGGSEIMNKDQKIRT